MRFLIKTRLVAGLLFSLLLMWSGCTEKEDTIIYLDTPTSCFQTFIRDPYFKRLSPATAVLLDSTIYFKNCSDSAQTIRYQWDFGDGASSEEKNPSHKFTKIGKFKVILTTINREKALDTASTVISVIIGQKNFDYGGTINNTAVDVVETNSGFVLLGTTNDNRVYPYAYTPYLMTLDEKMNKKGIKTYPANTRFNSISPDKDGNFLLTGTTRGGDITTEFIKMNSEGSILWSKDLGSTNTLLKVLPTPDNGYILTATRNIPGDVNQRSRTLLIKTDAQGNKVWERFMNQDLILEKVSNVVVENDGYVLAGVQGKDDTTPYCSYCDTLVIAKINPNGRLLWKKTVEWAINSDNLWNTMIAKLNNGHYSVINSNTGGVYLFSSNGEFLDRKLLKHSTTFQTVTKEGNLAILQMEWGNGFRAAATGLSPEGLAGWYRYIDCYQVMADGGVRCSDSWPIAIHALKKGGSILLANRVDQMEDSYSYRYVPVLLQLDDTGQAM